MLRQIEWQLQNGPITKSGVLSVTLATLFFLENLFQFQNPLKRVSYLMCTNGPNVHIRIFHKRWSLILCYGSFSLM